MKSQDVEYFVAEGEAAFYGPKIDVMVKDSLGREWQLTTVQLDFVQPENFDMKYINENGKEERPAVLHVAILGSVDRFFGILIEHFAGAFPVWLAPVQLTLIPIADRHQKAANILRDELKTQRIRVDVDDRQESMQSKIRQATLQKVPFLGIIGDKEITLDNLNYKNINVNLRSRDGKNLGVYNFDKLLSFLKLEIDNKN